jgi:DNA-directed RNA polymerase subunit RPC12/RpoP
MLSALSDSLLTLIYPQACRICGKSVEQKADGYVCRECWRATRVFTGDDTLCARCGAFLSDKEFSGETFCHRCDEDLYDKARAVGLYEKALASAVISLKKEPFIPPQAAKTFHLISSEFSFFRYYAAYSRPAFPAAIDTARV